MGTEFLDDVSQDGTGFYPAVVTDGQNVYPDVQELNFNAEDFYVSSDLNGNPVVNLKHEHFTKSITLQNPSKFDTISWWVQPEEATVEKLYGFLRTEDSGFYLFCDFTVRHGVAPTRGSGSELVTGGWRVGFYTGHAGTGENPLTEVDFDNPVIAPENYVWLETKNLGEGDGKEEELQVTLRLRY